MHSKAETRAVPMWSYREDEAETATRRLSGRWPNTPRQRTSPRLSAAWAGQAHIDFGTPMIAQVGLNYRQFQACLVITTHNSSANLPFPGTSNLVLRGASACPRQIELACGCPERRHCFGAKRCRHQLPTEDLDPALFPPAV
jgi:hypothetical protein